MRLVVFLSRNTEMRNAIANAAKINSIVQFCNM